MSQVKKFSLHLKKLEKPNKSKCKQNQGNNKCQSRDQQNRKQTTESMNPKDSSMRRLIELINL